MNKLRQERIDLSKAGSVVPVCKLLGVPEQAYYRWRKEHGGPKTDQTKKLKEPECEKVQLTRLLADAELDKAILKLAAV